MTIQSDQTGTKNPSVPYTDLGRQSGEVKKRLLSAVEAVLDSGHYILGPQVTQFEKEFTALCHARFSVGVSNGTSALYLALKAMGVGNGDEVITVPNSFMASASSIALAGAKPVFVDIGPDLNMNPALLEEAITARTKVLMPVHLAGRPARMPEILAIARKHGLRVLEDAAQSVGAKLDGKPVGSWADAGAFSLHPLKNLYAFGDAGMITTAHEDIQATLLKSRNHGLKNRNECEFYSFNCRLDEIQAAMLRVQLQKLDEWTERRRKLALRYNSELKTFGEVPTEGRGEYCVYQTYVFRGDRRDDLLSFLVKNGIDAKIHYQIPIHLQEAANHLGYTAKDFPETMRACSRILSLPLYPTLTEEQQTHVINTIKRFYAG